MEMRRPFQGVANIVRFNWPFYVTASGVCVLLLTLSFYLRSPLNYLAAALMVVSAALTLISLSVSWYVYDLSGFYGLRWLDHLPIKDSQRILNINAGFDETSASLKERFDRAELVVCDFYDEAKHTALSIKRARSAYPPFPGTHRISTVEIPLENDSVDAIFVVMSAHEIRSADERADFFIELHRVLGFEGQVVLVEHLRDVANVVAYNIGALHFHSRASWLQTFGASKLEIAKETKITPFITAFFLNKHGTTH